MFPVMQTNAFGLGEEELRREMEALGLERYRTGQVFYWLYNRAVTSFDAMSNVPKSIRALLAERFEIRHPSILTEQRSSDGTRKFLLELEDGTRVESVLIPAESEEPGVPRRLTLCISTQAGCPLACVFCATASMKLRRNLAPGEIAGQYFAVRNASERRITNIVYMGMGEPFLNYEATMQSIDILTHETACAVSSGHITVSTAGIPAGIERMADEGRKAKLAISLHAASDEQRRALMPIARKHDLESLLGAAEHYYRKTRRRITYEYILFDGFNDGSDDIRRLVRLARRIPSKINIIPFHSVAAAYPEGLPLGLRPSPPRRIEEFAQALRAQHLTVMVRSSAGQDIDAACGQLAVKHTRLLRKERTQ